MQHAPAALPRVQRVRAASGAPHSAALVAGKTELLEALRERVERLDYFDKNIKQELEKLASDARRVLDEFSADNATKFATELEDSDTTTKLMKWETDVAAFDKHH